ncbi:15410_t:CDS:2 [Acaulospora colombiana]|uniref:15410_t:CDS:1 n=1 Tax=Acaulospora colombiana TaxID=27376 RepID=A0ACA9K1I7_9GLOM|nr:15410_t:CDS:2 [Acaulospora colombiana]
MANWRILNRSRINNKLYPIREMSRDSWGNAILGNFSQNSRIRMLLPKFYIRREKCARFPAVPTVTNGFYRPSVDVSETDKSYLIEAEVPGMKKEDLLVEFIDDGTLILKGKTERARQEGTLPEGAEGMKTTDTTSEGRTNNGGDTSVVEATGEIREPTYWSSERVLGSFQRSFQFPGKVDPNNVKAAYKDGILSITVPKAERHGTKISIE